MKPKIAVYTQDDVLFRDLEQATSGWVELCKNPTTVSAFETVFVDGGWPQRHQFVKSLSEQSAFVVLMIREFDSSVLTMPRELAEGIANDVLLLPLRPLEVLSKVRHFVQLAQLAEVTDMNKDLKLMIERMQEDLRISGAIQKKFIPKRFDPISGVRLNHKYLSGLKSGGDYLDIFEFEDGANVGILMSDSSGYGLSSAFMSVMLRTAFKYNRGEPHSPAITLRRIYSDLKFLMKAKEDFSIFYGVFNRKTLEMNFASVGNVRFFKNLDLVNALTAPLKREEQFAAEDHQISLRPGDRLVFMTDGFFSAYDKPEAVDATFEKVRNSEPLDLVNECIHEVKRKFGSDDDMPEQDCSIIVMDLERTMMRLAKA